MAVRKRSNGKWFVDFRFRRADGGTVRIRRDSPVNTRRGAQEFERQLRNEQLNPTRPRKEVRFEDFSQEFEEVYVAANLKHATQITYESTIRVHLKPEFGKLYLADVSSHRIERFKARLQVGRSASTVRNTLGVLSRMLHIAKQWGYLYELPSFNLPRLPAPRFRFLKTEESQALLDAAGPYWGPPVYFALMTGCRQGELWGLERAQIDLDNAVARIDRAVFRGVVGLPKHDRVRTVDLSPALVVFLRGHLKVVPLRTRLVFPTRDGRMRNERKADTGLRRACRRAGLTEFGWHVLRHTFASNLVMKGVPLQVVQQLLGHSRIDETMRYAHISPHMKRDAVGKLDDLGVDQGGQYLGNEKAGGA